MNVTINDIAKVAGVSASTVSRVVNDSPLISENTKNKVRTVMKELNYTPNVLAKQLATQTSNTVGFLINTKSKDNFLDPMFYNIIGGSESVLLCKNYDLSICNINYLENDDNFLSRFVYSKKVDGIIVHVSIIDKQTIKELNELKFPYVVIGQPKEHLNTSWVDIDNKRGGEIATKHLLENNYRKIAFIGGTLDEPVSFNRLKGYKYTLLDSNLPVNELYIRESLGKEEDGYILMKELLSLESPPDSVICINNYTAFGVLKAIKEMGLSIPKNIGVVTFDSFPLAPYTTPSLTSLNIDTFEMGRLASEILLKRIENPNLQHQISMLLPELIVRDSSVRNL